MKSLPVSYRWPHRARRRSFRLALLGAALMLPAALLPLPAARAAEPGAPRQEAAAAAALLTVPMSVDWKYTTDYYGNNPTSPVVADGVVYFAGGNRVYAVDAKTGALKWRYPSDATLATSVQTTPALSDDTVFVGTGDGLYAFSRADGKQRWAPYHLRSGVVASPVLVGDTVYFGGGDGHVYAINSKTGDPLSGVWQRGVDAGGDISSDLEVVNGIAYYLTSSLDMHALSLVSGRQRWTQRLPATGRNNLVPVVSGESIYIAAGNALTSWRANNGGQRWYQSLPSDATSAPAVDANGTAYVVTADRKIYAVDKTGKGIWRQAALVDFENLAPPVVVGNLLLVGTSQGGLYAFDTATGKLQWNCQIRPSGRNANAIPTYTSVTSTPIVADGTLFVVTDDGSLTAYRNDAPDTTPPTVTDLEPALGDYLNGRPPFYFGARVFDDGSGLNYATISLKVDDQTIPRQPENAPSTAKPGFVFHPTDGTLEYYTTEQEVGKSNALSDGHHTVTVTASDWMGNTVTKTWTFFIDDTIQRRERQTANTRPGQGGQGGRPGFGGPGGQGGRGFGGPGGPGGFGGGRGG